MALAHFPHVRDAFRTRGTPLLDRLTAPCGRIHRTPLERALCLHCNYIAAGLTVPGEPPENGLVPVQGPKAGGSPVIAGPASQPRRDKPGGPH